MVVLGVTSNDRSGSSPSYGLAMAEGVGFEPTVSCPTPVFKSGVPSTSPSINVPLYLISTPIHPLLFAGVSRGSLVKVDYKVD